MVDKNKSIDRRSFVKGSLLTAAGVTGFPYFIPSSVLGRGGAVSPSNRLVMAQIGCGSQGGSNMGSFLGIGEVQIVAVCDVDQNNANGKKRTVDQRYGNSDCRVYGDFRELLEKENLDLVSHAIPDHWHAAISVACAKKGLDIYGEKPLARTIRESRAICDAVDRYGIIWQTGSWQRSRQDFYRAVELVRNGRIGKIEYTEVGLPDGNRQGPDVRLLQVPATFNYEMWLGSAPYRPYQNFGGGNVHWDWRWILDYSGGQLTDWAGHHIDVAHWGLDLERTGPVEIEGKGQYAARGIYDVPYAYDFTCTYANGVKIRVANAGAQPRGMGVCWYGENGAWIHADRSGLRASDEAILREQIGANEIHPYKSNDHFRNFVECAKSRKETIAPAAIAHRSISAGLLGEIAMLLGRKLKWDPAKETFINDDQAERYLMRPYRSPWVL